MLFVVIALSVWGKVFLALKENYLEHRWNYILLFPFIIYPIYPIKIKLYCIILSPEILTILEFSNNIWRKLNRKHSIFRLIFPDIPCFGKIYIAINSIDDKYFT